MLAIDIHDDEMADVFGRSCGYGVEGKVQLNAKIGVATD